MNPRTVLCIRNGVLLERDESSGEERAVDLAAILSQMDVGGFVLDTDTRLVALSALGDLAYGGASGVATRLAGQTTATKKVLTQTGTGTESAAPAWGTLTSADVGSINPFGTGADGAIVFDAEDNRWEDGSGAAIATVSGKWTVDGTTLTLLRDMNFSSVDAVGGMLIVSADSAWSPLRVNCQGSFRVRTGAVVRGGYHNGPSNSSAFRAGGVEKTTAGAGAAAASAPLIGAPLASWAGGSGAGGGDGTNIGGAGKFALNGNSAFMAPLHNQGYNVYPAGGTGAGAAGTEIVSSTTIQGASTMLLPGMPGCGGGGGALKVAGGSNKGGAGGVGGLGGGAFELRAWGVQVDAGGTLSCAGVAGTDGAVGVATNAEGDISGGGGGAGGGGGGMLRILYGAGGYSAAGTVSVAGGGGGAGGAGYEYNGVARATSNGGNGATGGTGILITEQIAT